MWSARFLQKCFLACLLMMLFCAAPALAGAEWPTSGALPGAQFQATTGYFKEFTFDVNNRFSRVNPVLDFANKLFAERKLVEPRKPFTESTWSIAPLLSRMAFSPMAEGREFGLVFKFRF